MQRSLRYLGSVILAATVAAACTSGSDAGSQTTPATETSADAETVTTSPDTTTTDTPAPPGPTVSEVPGAPDAAAALQPFINDLVAGRNMADTCWTVAPSRAREMYADVGAITSAATGTGMQHQLAVEWTDGTTSVTVKYPEISSGYACPYVQPVDGPDLMYTGPDAIYVAQRYLGRLADDPVDPEDDEARYPLVCEAGPSPHPLRDNPDPFGSVGFVDPAGAAAQPPFGGDDVRVTIPAEIDGLWRDVTARVIIGRNGYCVEEISAST